LIAAARPRSLRAIRQAAPNELVLESYLIPPKAKRWSQRVTEQSNALDLEPGVFTLDDPKAIARSLKRSAERSHRRKAPPYRSAMSMLSFYINRAGRHLTKGQRARLERAKDELRALFGKVR
jgi:hypothetical protein